MQKRTQRHPQSARIVKTIELSLPRECSACHENKGEKGYSRWQWLDIEFVGRKCRECLPVKQEEWQRAKEECLRACDLGYQVFHYGDPDGIDLSCLELEPCDLAGKYDIIFHRGWEIHNDEQRTTKGTMTLLTDDTGKLCGSIYRPPEVAKSSKVQIFALSFFFREEERSSTEIDCHIEKIHEGESNFQILAAHLAANWPSMPSTPFCVKLKKLSCKKACSWVCGEGGFFTDHQKTHNVSIENLEEAEKLMDQHNNYSKNSWIAKHLRFDTAIVQNIHNFCAWRPTPVLLFEPGDLCVTIV